MPLDVDAVVRSNLRITEEYNVVALEAPAIAAEVKPGQFVMVKPARGLDPLLRRPFSVFQIERDTAGAAVGLTLLNKKVGTGTALIFDLQPGERMACLGPLGVPFRPVGPPVHAIMVAGGVGLAPFATLAEALAARGTRMTLFYGGRRDRDLCSLDLFEQLGTGIVLTTEDGSRGERGLITQPLERALSATAAGDTMVYACGPTPMLRAVARLTARHDCASAVSLEPVMGCGLGGCYSCVVQVRSAGGGWHYVRACLDGPVFSSDVVNWRALGGHD